MPVRKHANRKNAPHSQEEAIVPQKDKANQRNTLRIGTTQKVSPVRINALTVVGRKKKPK